MASFASSRANRIPIQFLQLYYEVNYLGVFFHSPRSVTEREKGHWMSLGFFRGRKSSAGAECHENWRTVSTRPLGDEFFRVRPNLGIMMDRINGNRDNQAFRYVIIAQLVISRCHAIVSIRSTEFEESSNDVLHH